MNLSRKIRDSIAKYDNPDCAEVLFRQDNCRPTTCPPYGRPNCSDTCIIENDCRTPRYCRSPYRNSCGDKYCERTTSECLMRSPTGSSHEIRYSATNCSRPYRKRCPSPSPCCHNPYRQPPNMNCGPSDCRPSRFSRCAPCDPCAVRCRDPCEERFPRVCDSIILTKNRMSRTRFGRRCEPRVCPPVGACRSPCGRPRCRKPACNYRYPRNCVKPRVCCEGSPPPCAPPCPPSRAMPCAPRRPFCDPCKPNPCAPPIRSGKCCPRPPRCSPRLPACDPCDRPCSPRPRPPYCGPRSRCPPNCDSFKYPCFYYDKSCNNLCVKMVDGSPMSCEHSVNNCCKPLPSLFCSGSGTMFSISPYDRDKCRGDYNYKINNLRSMSNIRSAIFNNDCNDRYRPLDRCSPRGGACPPCGPGDNACPPCEPRVGGPCGPGAGACSPCEPRGGACPPCDPGACAPCPPRSRPYSRNIDCNIDYDNCKPCGPRRPCTRVKSLCFDDCGYDSRQPYYNSCGRPKTCPTPITPGCNTSCKCSGCTMFGPSYCVQRSNSRVPCLCAKYPCLPKFS